MHIDFFTSTQTNFLIAKALSIKKEKVGEN